MPYENVIFPLFAMLVRAVHLREHVILLAVGVFCLFILVIIFFLEDLRSAEGRLKANILFV